MYLGYKFRNVDGLITNFHLPESSLLMLVASFAANLSGKSEEESLEEVLNIYRKAASDGWRFFSFGDAMFMT